MNLMMRKMVIGFSVWNRTRKASDIQTFMTRGMP